MTDDATVDAQGRGPDAAYTDLVHRLAAALVDQGYSTTRVECDASTLISATYELAEGVDIYIAALDEIERLREQNAALKSALGDIRAACTQATDALAPHAHTSGRAAASERVTIDAPFGDSSQ